MKNIFAYLCVLMVLSACTSYEKEIETLDNLSLKLDTALVNMEQIDSVAINLNNQVVHENMAIIVGKYKNKLKKEQSFIIDRYRKINKTIKRFNRAYTNTLREIYTSKKQVQNLKTDLSNKAIKDVGKAQKFLADEVKAVTEVYEYTYELNDWYQNTNNAFDELNPKVQFLVDSLESKKRR